METAENILFTLAMAAYFAAMGLYFVFLGARKEKAAGIAGKEMAPYILKAVTTRNGVRKTLASIRPPIGERQFYAMRRLFFYTLHELRGG